MGDAWWVQLVLVAAGGLVGGGGLGVAWLQSRATRAVGVRASDVEEEKSAGALALDIASYVHTRSVAQDQRIDELEREAEEWRRDLEVVRGELRHVLAEVEAIARDLRKLVMWEESGANGPAPVSIAGLYARLEALNRRVKK